MSSRVETLQIQQRGLTSSNDEYMLFCPCHLRYTSSPFVLNDINQEILKCTYLLPRQLKSKIESRSIMHAILSVHWCFGLCFLAVAPTDPKQDTVITTQSTSQICKVHHSPWPFDQDSVPKPSRMSAGAWSRTKRFPKVNARLASA